MEDDWENDTYEEGEELYYDDDGAFGVGLPPATDLSELDPSDRSF